MAARRRAAQLLRGFDTSHPSPLQGPLLAMALIAAGDQQRALDVLERVEPRGAALWFWLRFAGFDGVRSDPRFQRIVADARPTGAAARAASKAVHLSVSGDH